MPDCIGLVAGEGELPPILARAMLGRGREVVAIALCEQAHARLNPLVQRLYSFGAGQGNRIIDTLKREGVRELVIIGKVSKEVLFRRWRLDSRALRVLRRAGSFRDDALLREVIREFESEGIRVVEQSHFLPELCPKGGVLTHRRPTRREWRDIAYGFSAARGVGALGIGQTIVVKRGTVLAVEGMEGTDETIARGCRLAQEGGGGGQGEPTGTGSAPGHAHGRDPDTGGDAGGQGHRAGDRSGEDTGGRWRGVCPGRG
ncbi:MAG: LpxI family protein [Nitrospinae bacterium]|nr:LpxI family protein [Nitrospinota bacterium]